MSFVGDSQVNDHILYIDQFVVYFEYCKALSFQADPDYDQLLNLFNQMINNYCVEYKYDYDWNDKIRAIKKEEIKIEQIFPVANTSLALNNNNISNNSPNANNDSHLNQVNNEINNMSIFQKE